MKQMIRFLFKRILMLVPVMLGVIVIIFAIRAITPGDPLDSLLSDSATEEQRAELAAELKLDKSLPVQFLYYVKGVVTGDFGTSYTTHQPVLKEILSRFPTSLKVCFGAVLIGLVLGVPLGIISALKQYSWLDSIILVLSMIAHATPGFCLAFVLITVFSLKLRWLPAVGLTSWKSYILPMATIGLASLANYTRITRSSMLEVIRQDYIRTARAKGQTESKITWSHALRNAAVPIVASVGQQFGNQLGGALIVETVFGLPGIGKYIGDAVSLRNWPALQGGVLFLALVLSLINLATDVAFTLVNPRLKSSIMSTKKTKFEKWLESRKNKKATAANA